MFIGVLFLLIINIYIIYINNIMRKKVNLTEADIRDMVYETVRSVLSEKALNEDMTRSQVESAIEDFLKGKDFEKRVNNIVVDTLGEFIENMWTKKAFWKNMIKKK